MLGILLAFPVLAGLVMVQSAVVSRMPLLNGTADLVLVALIAWALHERVSSGWVWAGIGGLMAGFLSALPLWSLPVAYLVSVGLASLIRRRIWKAPILAVLAAVFVGTIVVHLISLTTVSFRGTLFPVWDVLNLITLPSLVLNLMLAVPVYVVIHDLANWVYPEEFEI